MKQTKGIMFFLIALAAAAAGAVLYDRYKKRQIIAKIKAIISNPQSTHYAPDLDTNTLYSYSIGDLAELYKSFCNCSSVTINNPGG